MSNHFTPMFDFALPFYMEDEIRYLLRVNTYERPLPYGTYGWTVDQKIRCYALIPAIKRVREITQWSLIESKQYVDKIVATMPSLNRDGCPQPIDTIGGRE